VSRKLAKENVLLFLIIIAIMITPTTGFCNNTIQTTQHIIVIDPGHGGIETGIVSSGGLTEKTIVLKLAQKTAQQLETRYNVLLTRNQDVDIPFQERIFFTNKNKADLFLSIHLHDSIKPSFFLYYFDLPESYERLTPAGNNTWKSQPLIHQADCKQAVNSFLSIFSADKTAVRFFSKGAPIILLEGATMAAILIEPLSISTLSRHPEEIETILDEYALLISKSIDLYFKKK